jgi:hypothetical protein
MPVEGASKRPLLQIKAGLDFGYGILVQNGGNVAPTLTSHLFPMYIGQQATKSCNDEPPISNSAAGGGEHTRSLTGRKHAPAGTMPRGKRCATRGLDAIIGGMKPRLVTRARCERARGCMVVRIA